jgi:hypothetical protein
MTLLVETVSMSRPSSDEGIEQVEVGGGGGGLVCVVDVDGRVVGGRVVGGRVVVRGGEEVSAGVVPADVVVEDVGVGGVVEVAVSGVVELSVAGVDVVVVPGSAVPEHAVRATAIARTPMLLRPFTVPPGPGPSNTIVPPCTAAARQSWRGSHLSGFPRQDAMRRSRSAARPVATSVKVVDNGESPIRIASGSR